MASAWKRDPPGACDREPVDAHVREQVQLYGPQSIKHEYFGFIHRLDGSIGSAVTRGNDCPNPSSCGINTAAAAALIPRGAKVLGEWHTHPRLGSAEAFGTDGDRFTGFRWQLRGLRRRSSS